MNIKINCVCNCCSLFYIKIYNKNFCFNKYINNKLNIKLKPGVYNILIIANPSISPSCLQSRFIVKDDTNINYYFTNKEIFIPIQIKLIDSNYDNLLVEKGVISLWPNHIQ